MLKFSVQIDMENILYKTQQNMKIILMKIFIRMLTVEKQQLVMVIFTSINFCEAL